MKGSFRQSMAWLHTWSGLVIGWLLLAIFATGLASYFKADIDAWTRPELRSPADPIAAVEKGVAWIVANNPGVRDLTVVAADARNPIMETYWQTAEGGYGSAYLDPATGAPFTARDTLGGEFFYRFHFELMIPYPWGRYLAGCAAMAMFLAVLTGLVTHKRIFKDFFTFRPGKGQRSWLDMHNVLGVLSLPFHLMISFTGLVTLMTMYMPYPIEANYGDDLETYYSSFPVAPRDADATGTAAPLTPLGPVLADAAAHWDGRIGTVTVSNPGDAAARIHVARPIGAKIDYRAEWRLYDGVTGARLDPPVPSRGPALATEDTLYGLHMGQFSQPLLRWLYFLSGVGGFAMIATGLILWTVKRRPALEKGEPMPFSYRLVERLNVAAIAGVPIAMAAFFWANRLLPSGVEGRAEAETDAFLYALLGATVLAQLVPRAWLWRGACGLGAAAFLALPVINMATTSRGLLSSLAEGDIQMASFDLTLTAVGLAFATAALLAHRKAVIPAGAHRGSRPLGAAA